MIFDKYKSLSIITLALLAGYYLPRPAVAQTAAAAPDQLEEIIVTAQKREERLQNVPVSVTALSAKTLANLNIESGTELARVTPNLRASTLGDESQPKFSMRGLSMSTFNLNDTSPTGVFYDEVYVGAQYLGGAQMFDMDRVEVLRGPQGTLFGKNTTAGAINFISKAPTFQNEGYATVGYGSYNYEEVKGAVEIPLVADRLTVRLAVNEAHSDGYITNVTPGTSDFSNIDRKSARLTVGYKDDDGLQATLRLFRVEEDPHSIGAVTTGTGPGGTDILGRNPRINPLTGAPLGPYQEAGSPTFPNGIQVRGTGEYLTVVKDLGSISLTSITSHISGRFLIYVEADGTADDLAHLTLKSHNNETGQDLRLSTNGNGPFSAIGGLYFYQDQIDVGSLYNLIYIPVPLDQTYSQKQTSYAAYVNSTYDVADLFTVYGGVRYTDDTGHMYNFQVTPIIPPQPELKYHDGQPTGRFGLRKQFSPDLMVYGQIARGYRSSAFNGGAVAQPANVARPEFLTAYELGLKSQWLDRRLTVNTSAFWYKFKDQQFVSFVSLADQQLVNAGRSRLYGMELEVAAHPIDGLTLSTGIGLLDAKYLELELSGVNLSGHQMPEAPHSTVTVAADYSVPVSGVGGAMAFHVDATHVAAETFDASNAPVFHIDPFWDVGARIAYHLPGNHYEVAAYGKNLTGNQVPTGVEYDAIVKERFNPIPYPRRFGVELTGRF